MSPTLWIVRAKRVRTEDLAGRQPGRLTVDDQDIQPDSLVMRSSRTQPLSGMVKARTGLRRARLD